MVDALARVPPQNLEAEQSVLGGLLVLGSGEKLDALMANLADNLPAEDFYREAHRDIYAAMLELWQETSGLDAVTLADRLRSKGQLEPAGGLAYLRELADFVPTAAHVEHYARIVRDKATLRALAAEATAIAGMAYDGAETPLKLLEQAEGMLAAIQQRAMAHKRSPSLGENIELAFETLLMADRELVGTGFDSINRILLGGMRRGHLVVLGARTSKGKSALGFNIATRISRGGTVVVTLEMHAHELLSRALVEFAGVDFSLVRHQRRPLWESETERLQFAAGQLIDRNLEVIFAPRITPRQVRARVRAAMNRWDGKLDLVVVDYLQRMQPDVPDSRRRDLEIAQITDALKTMAGELNCAVLVLAQLTRETVKRENPMPMLTDLRESGAIEQDADEVLLLWDRPPKKEEHFDPAAPRKMHLTVAKQRNGPIGTIDLMYEPKLTKFSDVGRYGDAEVGTENSTNMPPMREEIPAAVNGGR